MKLIEMTIRGEFAHMLYADGATKEQSTEWVELCVKAERKDDNDRIGVIQSKALQRVRTLLNDENERFAALSDKLREAPHR